MTTSSNANAWKHVRRRSDGRRIADDITNAMSDLSESVERMMPLRDRVLLQWLRAAPTDDIFSMTCRDLTAARSVFRQRSLFALGGLPFAVVGSELIADTVIVSQDGDDHSDLVFRNDVGSMMDSGSFLASLGKAVALENLCTQQDDPDRPMMSSLSGGACQLGTAKTRFRDAEILEAEVFSVGRDETVRYRFFLGQKDSETD
jgi:hypothetical protein